MIFNVSRIFVVLILLIHCSHAHAEKDVFAEYDESLKGSVKLRTLVCQPYPKQKHQEWSWDGKVLRVDGRNVSGGELEWTKKKNDLVFAIQSVADDEYFADMFINFDSQRLDIPKYDISVRCYGY